MTNQNERIALAEFVGWRCHESVDHYVEHIPVPGCVWVSPEGEQMIDLEFDPRNSDADCMALVDALNDEHWAVRIHHQPETDRTHFATVHFDLGLNTIHLWTGDNYRDGVCELACKTPEVQEILKPLGGDDG